MQDEEGVWTRCVGVGWQQGKRERDGTNRKYTRTMGAQVFTIRDGSRNYRQGENKNKPSGIKVMM